MPDKTRPCAWCGKQRHEHYGPRLRCVSVAGPSAYYTPKGEKRNA